MPANHAGSNSAGFNKSKIRALFPWGESGRSIRRRIERRFNIVLQTIAEGDPEEIRETLHTRWLLDNSHLVRQALQQIQTDLPYAYYRQLPAIQAADGSTVPRVFKLVDDTIVESGLPVDFAFLEKRCCEPLSDDPSRARTEKCASTHLTLGELWAVPIALRIILLTRLCDIAEETIENSSGPGGIVEQDSNVQVIAECISSLRMVATHNWPDFVDKTSVVEQCLIQDPVAFYSRMDFETRDRYRQIVERIAAGAKTEQRTVALRALSLAQESRDSDDMRPQHVGYYLVDQGRQQLEQIVRYRPSVIGRLKRLLRKHCVGLYLAAIIGLAMIGGIVLSTGLHKSGAGPTVMLTATLIALIPLLSISSGSVNFLISLFVPPKTLPKLDFSDGIPAEFGTIVVVPMLLSSPEEIDENLKSLEYNYLGNANPGLHFALLSDFTDADTAEASTDKVLLEHVIAGIDNLNNRYAANGLRPFMLFHRRRLWNENARCWMGWERKRGKLEEFNELLRGANDTSYVMQHGNALNNLGHIQCVITLDADSYMPTGTATRLVGTMAHPLNRPHFDVKSGRIVGGYSVIQPRLETNPVTGADTLFARIFAGDVMLDLYTHAVSNVYQDLFGEAIFAGKGIYHVDAFRYSVAGQVATNTILSHDLLEGLLGRVGLASDIVLLENYPSNYLVFLKRMHRWMRGDWQLLPWLFSRKTDGSRRFAPGVIGRWKLFDNLRRSLVAPAILTLLIFAWLGLSTHTAAWTIAFALFPGLPIVLRVTLALRTSMWRWGTIQSSLRNLLGHAGADAARWTLALVFLPAESYLAIDAALRTVFRIAISHRQMLEWSPAAQVTRAIGKRSPMKNYWHKMWIGPTMALALSPTVLAFNQPATIAAVPFLLLWFGSPLIAFHLSRRIMERGPVRLSDSDARFVRRIARDTWRFFERFVGPESSWLPPDNVQEYPKQSIAERTSPTNIGMMLLSTLTAWDLGYLGQRQLLTRLTSHLDSILRMQKHRGHLFNWYSTRNLQPLEPRYVSTVDSGNLVAAFIVVRQALEELAHNSRSIDTALPGLEDELVAMRHHLASGGSKDKDNDSHELIQKLDQLKTLLTSGVDFVNTIRAFEKHHCNDIDQSFLRALDSEPHRWSSEQISVFREDSQIFQQRIRIILEDIDLFAAWAEQIAAPPETLVTTERIRLLERLRAALNVIGKGGDASVRLNTATRIIAELTQSLPPGAPDHQIKDTLAWLDDIQRKIDIARREVQSLEKARQSLVNNLSLLTRKTDFAFLYDHDRNLFRVGYNASTGEADNSYYDLLASEARIASFVAIAKGDVPAKHWMKLGRPITRLRGLRILLSWSATAFEYLMPRLIMRSPSRGLLNQSCEGLVKEQIRFGRKFEVPWGVSESGYAELDSHNQYQYYAFGIPNLGLKWDQGERLVVSGYSSILAMAYAPRRTLQNLKKMIRLGASGRYGLYEALDFGDAHAKRLPRPRIVRSYMSHHQGMIIVAIGNALLEDETLHRFHRDPHIASVEHLLYERLPQRMQTHPLEHLPTLLKEKASTISSIREWTVETDEPELAVLSNGRLSSHVSDQGGGTIYWRGIAVTRWNPLLEGPASGSCIYFKDLDDDRVFCLGGEPLRENIETLFAPHIAEFRAHRKNMLMRMTVTVAPAADVEIRRITVTNDGPSVKRIILTSYSEPVLGQESADRRHPAFSKLFIESRYSESDSALIFRRRPREPGHSPVYLANSAVAQPEFEVDRQIETDRRAFFGRGSECSKPSALSDPDYVVTDVIRANLDQCAAISLTLKIPPGTTIQCAFLSSVGETPDAAIDALRPLRSLERINWTMETSRLHSEREMTEMRVNSDDVRGSYRLFAKILWPRTMPHISVNSSSDIRGVQDSLWRHGISGDHPIVTLRLDGEEDLHPAARLLRSVQYLSYRDVCVDVIFLDETTGGYTFPVYDQLRKLVQAHNVKGPPQNRSAVFIVPIHNLSADEKNNLIAAARFFIDTRSRTMGVRPETSGHYPVRMPAFIPQPSAPLTNLATPHITQHEDLVLRGSHGGMLPDLNGYSMLVSDTSQTPAPWCNVLVNPGFGSLVSESGSMCTWWHNSSEYRLTPWSNDPVLNRTGEAIYVRDEETGESWSMTPLNQQGKPPWRVTHAIGESLFEHNNSGLQQQLRIFVDPELPLKFLQVRLLNQWPRNRRLTVTYAVEWLLGNAHTHARHLLLPERDADTGALLIRNAFDRHAGEHTAFVAADLEAHGVTCDGVEFFGARRSWTAPAALTAVGLSDRIEPGSQPCAVYQVHVDMKPGEVREFHFVLGAADDRQTAGEIISQSRNPAWVTERYGFLRRRWDYLLGAWKIVTPDVAADAMINRWLLYQVVSSRLWGRVGFYQASGAFGFRDQLQDVLALLDTQPELAREQILRAASRQFEEGDALHWWHEAPLRGVRTRCSDDLLWLPYAVVEFVDVTDDGSILGDTATFLEGEPLGDHEQERYAEFQAAPSVGTIYEHCCRAIDARIAFGAHGLPFFGSGDWNDGMNRVGVQGQGESVWMAWFLIVICRRFAPLCRLSKDDSRADHYEAVAAELLDRTKKTAWAGLWYMRGFYDDGTPLGSPGDDESEIDLNAQTWAVFADAVDANARQAMQAAEEKLVDTENRLVKLLAPPFDKTVKDPGYIKSYPPGVRENGGQYTHAAVWAAWAAADLGNKDKTMQWFEWLNPLFRSDTADDTDHYRLEPYVVPGDIYSVGALAGRGGWSWYTGSAAWMYRFAIRRLLGMQRQGDRLFVRPCIPSSWPGFSAVLRHKDAEYRFRIHDPVRIERDKLFIISNGSMLDVRSIVLEASGIHEVEVFPSDAARRSWAEKNQRPSGKLHTDPVIP